MRLAAVAIGVSLLALAAAGTATSGRTDTIPRVTVAGVDPSLVAGRGAQPRHRRAAGGRRRHERSHSPVQHVGLHARGRGVGAAGGRAPAGPVRRLHAQRAGERGDDPLRDPGRPERRRHRRAAHARRRPQRRRARQHASADDHAHVQVLLPLQPLSVHERPERRAAPSRLVGDGVRLRPEHGLPVVVHDAATGRCTSTTNSACS